MLHFQEQFNMSVLKVYPAKYWHDSPVIIGSKEALIRLRDLIDRSLINPADCCHDHFIEADGKEFIVKVRVYDSEELQLEDLPAHYEDEELTESEKKFLYNFVNESHGS
jgi:hypothetical protein